MQLCAITDRQQTARPLLHLVEEWSNGGVHFIQLREKDLDPSALELLTRQTRERIKDAGTKLLLNISNPASASLARAAGAHGVHLAGKPRPGSAGNIRSICGEETIVSVPCHDLEDVSVAVAERVDLILFSPIFEKEKYPASLTHGLEGLRNACVAAQNIPIFALGGVNSENAPSCQIAGAAGIAGIRLFAGDEWRRLSPAT
jgi:thiamine-phosphate pyrophosphorylase